MSATATVVKETTPKYTTVTNMGVVEAIKVVFGALSRRKDAEEAARKARKEYSDTLVVLPSIWLAHKAGESVKGLLALGDLDDSQEQQMRYYLRGGRVLAELANDGKTAPAVVMTRVNFVSQRAKAITIAQIDEIIDELVAGEGKTWADFVNAVDSRVADKTVETAISTLEKALKDGKPFTAGDQARIERLLANITK
jgi:hypothetical protein